MKELLKKQLDKYIDTNKESRLDIFIGSVNSEFKATKKKKELLSELIDEYKKDPDVLDDILAFLGFKNSEAPKQMKSIEEINAHLDTTTKEKYAKGLKYDILDEVCKKHLGDPEDINSIAYKVCKGKIYEFYFPATAYKPDVVVTRLLRKNFVESDFKWHSFWDDPNQRWVCTTNASYSLKTSKHLDDKSGG